MIRINLCSDPTLQVDKREFTIEMVCAACAIALAYFGPGFYAETIRSKANGILAETAQKEAAIEKLKTDNKTINQFKIAISDLKERTEKVRNLSLGRKQPVLILDKIQQQHPDRLWLEKIELENGLISLAGVAAETELISVYALRIKGLNSETDTAAIDIETFVPPFSDFLEKNMSRANPEHEKLLQSTLPIMLSELNIISSDLITIQDTPLYRFLINFRVKLPEGI